MFPSAKQLSSSMPCSTHGTVNINFGLSAKLSEPASLHTGHRAVFMVQLLTSNWEVRHVSRLVTGGRENLQHSEDGGIFWSNLGCTGHNLLCQNLDNYFHLLSRARMICKEEGAVTRREAHDFEHALELCSIR
jgi:hypothetical protein